jgi:hypothetical protein
MEKKRHKIIWHFVPFLFFFAFWLNFWCMAWPMPMGSDENKQNFSKNDDFFLSPPVAQ